MSGRRPAHRRRLKHSGYHVAARVAPWLRRGPVACTLIAVNLGHAAIHGTPLDGGMLDGLVTQLDAWLLSQAQL